MLPEFERALSAMGVTPWDLLDITQEQWEQESDDDDKNYLMQIVMNAYVLAIGNASREITLAAIEGKIRSSNDVMDVLREHCRQVGFKINVHVVRRSTGSDRPRYN